MRNYAAAMFLAFICYFTNSTAQENKNLVYPSDEAISLTPKEILFPIIDSSFSLPAIEFEKSKSISNVQLDFTESSPRVLVFSKPTNKKTKGKIITYYDLVENKALWSCRAYMAGNWFTKEMILLFNDKVTVGIDKATGKQKWMKLGSLSRVYDDLGLFQANFNYERDLVAEIATGKNVTSFNAMNVDIDQDFLDGKTLYKINENYLHAINREQGNLWQTKIKTWKINGNRILLSSALAGASVGILNAFAAPGTCYTYTYVPNYRTVGYQGFSDMQVDQTMVDNRIYGLHSDVLEIKGNTETIWMADKNSLMKIFAGNGNIFWSKKLPARKNGNMVLKELSDKMVLICSGKAITINGIIKHGKPYLYEFDKNTGDSLRHIELGKNYINEYLISEEDFIFSTRNAIQKLLFQDGSITGFNYGEDTALKSKYGDINGIVDENRELFYLKKGEGYVSFEEYFDFENNFVLTCEKGLLVIDSQSFELVKFIPLEFLARLNYQVGNYLYLTTHTVDEYGSTIIEKLSTIIDVNTMKKVGVDEQKFTSNYYQMENGMFAPQKRKVKTYTIINTSTE